MVPLVLVMFSFLRDLSVMKRGVPGQQQPVVEVLADRQLALGYLQLVIDPVADLELLVRQPPARIEISIVASAVGVVPHRGDKGLLPSRQTRIALRIVDKQLQPVAINGCLFLRPDSGRRFSGHGNEYRPSVRQTGGNRL